MTALVRASSTLGKKKTGGDAKQFSLAEELLRGKVTLPRWIRVEGMPEGGRAMKNMMAKKSQNEGSTAGGGKRQ